MPDDRDKQPPKSGPLRPRRDAVPQPVDDRGDITGQFDTTSFEGQQLEHAERLRRTQHDAARAADSAIDIRARLTSMEAQHVELRTSHAALALVVATQDGKLDTIISYGQASDRERQRRADADDAKQAAAVELDERRRLRASNTRRILLKLIPPILAALAGLITAAAGLKVFL